MVSQKSIFKFTVLRQMATFKFLEQNEAGENKHCYRN